MVCRLSGFSSDQWLTMRYQVFKAYAIQTLGGATYFVQDLKLGHYMKVPPRSTFMGENLLSVISTPLLIQSQSN